ncbi:hypothetical protein JCM8097_009318 [Rhodosporidiobolus ruineniae]
MGRKRTLDTPPSNHTAFRTAERLYKKSPAASLAQLAFDPSRVVWETNAVEGRVRGVWTNSDGGVEECWKVRMGDLSGSGMGRGGFKGKEREGEGDWAVVVPRIPGLVLFPAVLPPALQRSLVVETLSHARRPNLTNLDPFYTLPKGGLWSAWTEGRGEEVVPSFPFEEEEKEGTATPASGSGYGTPSTEDTLEEVSVRLGKKREVTVRELLPKLRWNNVGYHYNWTTKLYEFERGHVPLPPLILRCCRDIVRATPWDQVFDGREATSGEAEEWRKWSEDYEPDAGIVNFYQIKDSLTGHVDQAEEDAVRPLVSFSLGHSSIFLVGGTTRDVPPLAILLRSGDGLCMSGPSRRAYHGLPRVLPDSLPDFLASTQPEPVDGALDWRPYGEYLERGARINVNVRSVY